MVGKRSREDRRNEKGAEREVLKTPLYGGNKELVEPRGVRWNDGKGRVFKKRKRFICTARQALREGR